MHLWNLFHIVYKGGKIDLFRGCFEQNIDGFTHNAPGSYHNEHCDPNGEDRVHRRPTSEVSCDKDTSTLLVEVSLLLLPLG